MKYIVILDKIKPKNFSLFQLFTFTTKIYGCQMNIADAQRVSGVLTKIGGQKIEDENKAEIIIFITCSVRQKGEERVKGKIAQLKEQNPQSKIGLTGCMIHHGEKKLQKLIPELNFVFRVDQMNKLPQKLNIHLKELKLEEKELLNRGELSTESPISYFSLVPQIDSSARAYIPIMSGCDNFCSYCIVPLARGRERSRSSLEIINEVKSRLSEGFPEIFLLGQNVNSYCCPETEINFSQLLQELDKLNSQKFWLRFISSHPKDLSDNLVQCFSELNHLTPWMHLPIQSGSDQVLQKMNRKYNVKQFAILIKKLRQARPDIAISTDVIIGFPGETENDFIKTLESWKKFQFDFSYIAQYSIRPGTAAAAMVDDVLPAQKKERWERLNKLQKEISERKLARLVEHEVEILVEKVDQKWVEGKTAYMQNVRLSTPGKHQIKPGAFVAGKIIENGDWAVFGELNKTTKRKRR